MKKKMINSTLMRHDEFMRSGIYKQKQKQQQQQQQLESHQQHFTKNFYDNCIIENNMYSKRQYLRVNFDRFTILNDEKKLRSEATFCYSTAKLKQQQQPAPKEIVTMNSNIKKKSPQETHVHYTWDCKQLPKLIPTNVIKPDLDARARSAQQRMKIAFQQKQIEEQKQNELRLRYEHLFNKHHHRYFYEDLPAADENETIIKLDTVVESSNQHTTGSNNNSLAVAAAAAAVTAVATTDTLPQIGNYNSSNLVVNNHSIPSTTTGGTAALNKYAPLINHNTTKGFKNRLKTILTKRPTVAATDTKTKFHLKNDKNNTINLQKAALTNASTTTKTTTTTAAVASNNIKNSNVTTSSSNSNLKLRSTNSELFNNNESKTIIKTDLIKIPSQQQQQLTTPRTPTTLDVSTICSTTISGHKNNKNNNNSNSNSHSSNDTTLYSSTNYYYYSKIPTESLPRQKNTFYNFIKKNPQFLTQSNVLPIKTFDFSLKKTMN